jgi:uncharacterized 2Fe-2S/4Fe-4S cluster protein (DUF4445 family)
MAERAVYLIDFEPVGRRIEVQSGLTLLEAAQSAGVELVAICGGSGSCGTCRVRLMHGELSPLTLVEEAELSQEEIRAGYRMACQSHPLSNVSIDIPPESLTAPQRLQIEGQGIDISLDPVILPVDIQVVPPGLYDLRSDVTRVKTTLGELGYPSTTIEHTILTFLSERLRAQDWSSRLALRNNEVVGILPLPVDARRNTSNCISTLLGFAVDVGTTKLAAYLVDLTNGKTLAKAGAMNPQIGYGEDVVSRIAFANEHADGRGVLQERLVTALNQLVNDLCAEVGASREQVVEAVIVGNTAMHHLFAGLPVRQLGASPFVPVVSESLELRARDIGLTLAPAARVYLPPNIAGYVGADHVAMLLAMDVARTKNTVVALDIGTNTEISLVSEGHHLSCSCASGPAFEGAHIHDGMRAAPGAIERIRITDGVVRIHTIGGLAPIGICGSGILDAIAELLSIGVIDKRGNMLENHPSTRRQNGKIEFVLSKAESSGHGRDVVVTRADVNTIQLAKGAIRAGVEVLLKEAGKNASDIQEFIVAGAFGTYLDLKSAVRIGMFPDLPINRFHQVGNAAGTGARQLLISAARRQEAERIARHVDYIELTTHPAFTEEFYKALMF